MNFHARVLVLQNDVKEWQSASVAEALTRTIDGHTRQRLDLAALGSGTARGRVTVLSASGVPHPWAELRTPSDTLAFADT